MNNAQAVGGIVMADVQTRRKSVRESGGGEHRVKSLRQR